MPQGSGDAGWLRSVLIDSADFLITDSERTGNGVTIAQDLKVTFTWYRNEGHPVNLSPGPTCGAIISSIRWLLVLFPALVYLLLSFSVVSGANIERDSGDLRQSQFSTLTALWLSKLVDSGHRFSHGRHNQRV